MTRRRIFGMWAIAAGLALAIFAQSFAWTQAYFQGRAETAARATLSLVVDAVEQAVGRYSPLPSLIAGDPALQAILRPGGGASAAAVNEKLHQIAQAVGASELYVMDRTGLTVATSNYQDSDSFLGKNFGFRPYFLDSLAGEAAFFHALGTTSGERGFFFSAPIYAGGAVAGVLALKITADAFEQDWRGAAHEILIADDKGIVFLTSRVDFKFRTLAPLGAEVRARIAETQQFPLDRLRALDTPADALAGPEAVTLAITREGATTRYLTQSAPLDLAGWHALVLSPLQPVQLQAYRSMALGGFVLIAAVLAALLVLQRRANILSRIELEQAQRAELEDKVRQRTRDLDTANASLRAEVTERRHAEERLRKSQKELIQAGKLAALGQMSAAISHEINQPLAAIKSYAVNAAAYLERGRLDEAQGNVASISELTDRMAEISHHLRNFARQPGDALKVIDVGEVITETIALVGPQLRATQASIVFAPVAGEALALGGKLRLQQVLVNIITNALEAMREVPEPRIEISVTGTPAQVVIALRDHGPGLRHEDLDRVFDAFYTTKEAGAGMGLGMSISANIISDFGGALRAQNHPEGGALFTVSLQAHRSEPVLEAAQ